MTIGKSLAALFLGTAAVAGCTTTGTGIGDSRVPGDAATFTWTAQGARNGTMTATLGNGASYAGPFFQVTQETQVNDLSPLWVGWGGGGWGGRRSWWGGRRGFGYWGDWGPSTQFVTHYSGKVLANLGGSDGRMRCRFTLMRPSSGMAGGGEGDCQLPAGATIQATFARS